MQPNVSNRSFFVKVDGHCHSTRRNPKGVYKVDVTDERTLVHGACAALQTARDAIPFLHENPDSFTLRAFREDGREIIIPRRHRDDEGGLGLFRGRATDHPEIITLQ